MSANDGENKSQTYVCSLLLAGAKSALVDGCWGAIA